MDYLLKKCRIIIYDKYASDADLETAEYLLLKYLKSQKCLKKVVNNLVFEIDFFSSKWNKSYEIIDIEASFVLM